MIEKVQIDFSMRGKRQQMESLLQPEQSQTAAGGLAILLSATLQTVLKDIDWLNEALNSPRYAAVTGTINGRKVSIHSIYAPVTRHERAAFFCEVPRAPVDRAKPPGMATST